MKRIAKVDAVLVRFLLVGAGTTLFGLLVFRGFVALLGGRRSAGAAQALTYAIGIVLTYVLNRNWTFRSGGAHARQLPRFVAMHLTGLALSSVLLQAGASLLAAVPLTAIWVVVTGCISVASFLVQRGWIFRTA